MMIRTHLIRALLISAASLVVTGAAADSPKSEGQGQGKGHAAEPAKNAGAPGAAKAEDKKDNKADPAAKADDKAKPDDKAKGKDDARGNSAADREARKAKQHDEQREKLKAMLKNAPDDAIKQELRRHAERTARLERIKSLATDAKDKDTLERAAKLIEKEDARHEKWMSKHAASAAAPGAAAPATAAVPPNAAADKKGGAQ